MRSFGLDVHLDFCEVAVAKGGRVSPVGRIASSPEAIDEIARRIEESITAQPEARAPEVSLAA